MFGHGDDAIGNGLRREFCGGFRVSLDETEGIVVELKGCADGVKVGDALLDVLFLVLLDDVGGVGAFIGYDDVLMSLAYLSCEKGSADSGGEG